VTRHIDVLARASLVHDEMQRREHLRRFEPSRLDQARRSRPVIGQTLPRLRAALER
jgi:hypothetical protein